MQKLGEPVRKYIVKAQLVFLQFKERTNILKTHRVTFCFIVLPKSTITFIRSSRVSAVFFCSQWNFNWLRKSVQRKRRRTPVSRIGLHRLSFCGQMNIVSR